jgi:hypothetical protein
LALQGLACNNGIGRAFGKNAQHAATATFAQASRPTAIAAATVATAAGSTYAAAACASSTAAVAAAVLNAAAGNSRTACCGAAALARPATADDGVANSQFPSRNSPAGMRPSIIAARVA